MIGMNAPEDDADLEDGEILDEEEMGMETAGVDTSGGKAESEKKTEAKAAVEIKGNMGQEDPSRNRPKIQRRRDEENESEPKKQKRNHHHHRHQSQEEGLAGEQDEDDDEEMMFVRGASPNHRSSHFNSPGHYESPYDSYESEYEEQRGEFRHSGDRRGRGMKRRRGGVSSRGGGMNKRPCKTLMKREQRGNESICKYFMHGKCQRGESCPYSHDAVPPRKMELCKFYLMDCCAKKEKCLYMHSDFPCKFYHTGLECFSGDKCKFSHGELTEEKRIILLKHLETAPREILGDFPREGASAVVYQKPMPKWKKEKKIPSLLDLEVSSPASLENGDFKQRRESDEDSGDERSRRKQVLRFYQETLSAEEEPEETRKKKKKKHRHKDDDERKHRKKDKDRSKRREERSKRHERHSEEAERKESPSKDGLAEGIMDSNDDGLQIPLHLPKKQRELFLRIQQQQREVENRQEQSAEEREVTPEPVKEEKWYSSDEEAEDSSLTDVLKNLSKQPTDKENSPQPAAETSGSDLMSKLSIGDLSHIDITPDITKLLQTIRNQSNTANTTAAGGSPMEASTVGSSTNEISPSDGRGQNTRPRDPRLCSRDPRDPRNRADPRMAPRPQDSPIRDPRDPRSGIRPVDTDSRVTPRVHEPTLIPQEPRTPRVPLIPETLMPLEARDPRSKGLLGDVDLRQLPESDTDLRKSDTDLRSLEVSGTPDVDLRNVSILGLPFKPAPPHTPATEIDASLNSHPPMTYKLIAVTIPRPNYATLKIAITDPLVKCDPRLKKIFRLSPNEPQKITSPRSSSSSSASASSSSPGATRVDPRVIRSPDHGMEAPRGDPRKNRRTSDPDPRLARPDPRVVQPGNSPTFPQPPTPPADPRLLKRQDSVGAQHPVDPRSAQVNRPSGGPPFSYPPKTPRPTFDDSDSDDDETPKTQWGVMKTDLPGGNPDVNPWGFFTAPKNEPPNFNGDVRWEMMN